MKIKISIISFLFLLLLSVSFVSYGQNNTSSPYSIFGIGDLSNVSYGRNLGMGGTGYALRSSNYLNFKNPASLTAIDTLTTLFEVGVFGKATFNSSNESTNTFWDGNLSHVTMGHRFNSWLMGSFGLMPYSDIGYYFRTVKSVVGEDSYVYTDWKGSGGINRFFYSLGFKISENFSLGSEVAYYYGPLKETLTTTTIAEISNPTLQYYTTRYNGFSYKVGLQYSANLGDKGTNFTIGGVFSPTMQFFGKTVEEIQQNYNSSVAISIYSDETSAKKIKVPMSYGAGASFIWRNKLLWTADYESVPWSVNSTREYKDQQIYSFGLERLPIKSLKYFDRCSYRFGVRYDSGYFSAKGYTIDDYRVTLGMGLPIKKSRSTINVSLEAGQRGKTSMGLLRERYTKLSVAFSFHDYWFVKRKID